MKILFSAAALGLVCSLVAPIQAKPMMKMAISDADKKFLTENAQGSVYDAATAEMAAQKATSPALHSYGIQLIGDHARLNQILMTLARQKKVTLPVTLADEDKTNLEKFSGLSGSAFDRAIVAEFVKINAKDVSDGRKEISITKDPQIKSAVSEFVRTEEKHLSSARALQKKLG